MKEWTLFVSTMVLFPHNRPQLSGKNPTPPGGGGSAAGSKFVYSKSASYFGLLQQISLFFLRKRCLMWVDGSVGWVLPGPHILKQRPSPRNPHNHQTALSPNTATSK